MLDEELIWQTPSVWSERNAWVRSRVDELWARFCRASVSAIELLLVELEQLESTIEGEHGPEIRRRTAAEGDLTWYADYDRPWDYMRSTLCGVLLAYPKIANAMLEESDLQNLAKLLRDVSETYVVNHVDTLWMQVNCLRQRVAFSAELPNAVIELLPLDQVAAFLVEAHANRKGRSAIQDGMRVWGPVGGGYVELHVRLSPDSSTVVVEGGNRTS